LPRVDQLEGHPSSTKGKRKKWRCMNSRYAECVDVSIGRLWYYSAKSGRVRSVDITVLFIGRGVDEALLLDKQAPKPSIGQYLKALFDGNSLAFLNNKHNVTIHYRVPPSYLLFSWTYNKFGYDRFEILVKLLGSSHYYFLKNWIGMIL